MVKRKRQHPDIEEVLERPWCYYCERDFDDLKILISHQKAKHYKCDQCGRRLNTAGGLSVHMSQVHKESLTSIENALPNRNDVNIEIFGMEGVPADVLEAHRQRITNEYFKRMAARRAETGNPPPGAAQATQTKRVKAESGEELRKRLAEHKARREAQKSGKLDPASHSGANTPNLLDSLMPDPSESKDYVSEEGSSAQGTPMQPTYSPSAGMPSGAGYPQSVMPVGGGFPGFMPQHMGMPYNHPPPPMPSGDWMHQMGGAQHHSPASPAHFSPFNRPQSQAIHHPSLPQGPFAGSPLPPDAAGLPRPPLDGIRAEATHPLPQLPARPAVDAPNLSKEDMARMHAGRPHNHPQAGLPYGMPPPMQNTASPSFPASSPYGAPQHQQAATGGKQALSDSVDELIRSVLENADKKKTEQAQTPQPALVEASPVDKPLANGSIAPPKSVGPQETPAQETRSKKSAKKSKDADVKLAYSDTVISPEEKKAALPRYAFTRDDSTTYVLGDVAPAVTGVVRGSDHVGDPQG